MNLFMFLLGGAMCLLVLDVIEEPVKGWIALLFGEDL